MFLFAISLQRSSAFVLAIIGGFVYEEAPILGVVLVFGGLIAFFVLAVICVFAGRVVCTGCGRKDHKFAIALRIKDGTYRCPRCGTISRPND